MTVEIAVTALVAITFLAMAAKRLMTYLHVLQQEDYFNDRLLGWIGKHRVFDKRLSLALLVLGGAAFFLPPFVTGFLIFLSFVTAIYFEKDPRKNSKKNLVSTTRAKRIFFTALGLMLAFAAAGFWIRHPWGWIAGIQAVPFILILANRLLQPFENKVQQKYWNEAHEKIQALRPTIIGITGSFGKTSVKHILGHILKMHATTLITPGSVNTPMGIARIIREQLTEDHKFLLVEMGAYGPGSIERLCRLSPPDYGIITAIGHAHYERFKTLEAVAETKYELAESVLKKAEGKVIAHERTLRFDHTLNIKNQNKDRFIICGEAPDLMAEKGKEKSYLEAEDFCIQKIDQMPDGLEIRAKWKGETYAIEAPLFGLHHGQNVAIAVVAAMALGITPEDIAAALKTLPQIQHRLEVKKFPDGTTIIDDAYNSNPLGFRSALDLMAIINNKNGRNILITPGMVEMGAAHDDMHEKLGHYAGQVCDVAIIIQPKRIKSFVDGFKSSAAGKALIEMDSFQAASNWVQNNKQNGDVILIENDLPDIYERIPKM